MQVVSMWRFKGHRPFIRNARRIHETLVLSLPIGYPCNCRTLYEKRLASKINIHSGNANIKQVHLVDPKNILMSHLHIKLGLMKTFFKQLRKSKSNGFAFLCNKFPEISEAKLKEGIFVGPQIRQVLKDPDFDKKLTSIELRAWKAF